MLKISDVLSVIQDLPRPRQAEILDQLYDKLDTKVERDQLSVFAKNDQDLLKFADRVQFGGNDEESDYVKRTKQERDLSKVTRLSVVFAALHSEYDLHKYSSQLPLQQVIDNYRYNKTAWTSDALAYSLSLDSANIIDVLTDLGDPELVLSIIQLAVKNDDLETAERVLEYLSEIDDETIGEIIVDFFYALNQNEVSRRFLAWYQRNKTPEDVAMDIVQSMIVMADRTIPLLKMIGERIEDYIPFLSSEHSEPFPDLVTNMLNYRERVDFGYILSLLHDNDDEDGITVVEELANNQV